MIGFFLLAFLLIAGPLILALVAERIWIVLMMTAISLLFSYLYLDFTFFISNFEDAPAMDNFIKSYGILAAAETAVAIFRIVALRFTHARWAFNLLGWIALLLCFGVAYLAVESL